MNKAELIEEVRTETGLTKKTSREAVDAIILAITDSLGRQEKVTLVGFGTFQVMERKARKGRNPKKPFIQSLSFVCFLFRFVVYHSLSLIFSNHHEGRFPMTCYIRTHHFYMVTSRWLLRGQVNPNLSTCQSGWGDVVERGGGETTLELFARI